MNEVLLDVGIMYSVKRLDAPCCKMVSQGGEYA